MRRDFPDRMDWELNALSLAVSSFFKRRVAGGDGDLLAKLTEGLARSAGTGSSHLLEAQVREISDDWRNLPGVGGEDQNLPLVHTPDGKLYFRRFFEYEKQVAEVIGKRLARSSVRCSRNLVDFYQSSLAGQLDEEQALAVGVALQKHLLLLTGGPGTGKTRTIVAILAVHLQANPDLRIALAAPTGKAAFRMRESVLEAMRSLDLPASIVSTLLDASRSTTLHRLLDSKIASVSFRRNRQNPLPHDLVVVDEASMVDLPLMAKLCDALPDKAKLILVGDADQLAPVQGGAVFNGLIKPCKSNLFSPHDLDLMSPFSKSGVESRGEDPLAGSLVCLGRVHRREGSSSAAVLGKLCDAIRDGKAEDALALAQSGSEGIRFVKDLEDSEIDAIIRRGFERLAKAESAEGALQGLGDFRILCAHNQGRYGVTDWNLRADGLLPAQDTRARPLVVGVNDYTVGLFNGDDGVTIGNRAYFGSEDGTRELARSRLPRHDQGYAISIHRSQGSEFKEVMIVLPAADARLLTRELLYVAVSRAKGAVTLVGDGDALRVAVERSQESRSGALDLLNRRPAPGESERRKA